MSTNTNALATNVEVFVYTGAGGAEVPKDVVRVRVDPSVTSIHAKAFIGRKTLTEVELCEGLVEIGEASFEYCDHSITYVVIPNSLRRICNSAFPFSLRCPIRLHDGIESIGRGAFAGCIFTNFRVPPLITAIPNCMLYGCRAMFSLELPEDLVGNGKYAFLYCFCLRNVAFPPNAVFGNNIFFEDDNRMDTDLYQLFGSESQIKFALRHRFDGLPIHKLVYYQSYHQGVLQYLIAIINMTSGQGPILISNVDPTGNQQDCLGMTPLHILACSSVHDLEVYRLVVKNYPTNLITEDRWGALPLLYAFWGAAPAEIIQLLLDSYQSLYPNYALNWTMMVEAMGRCDTPKESIDNLFHVQQTLFPDQQIDWVYLLDKFARPSKVFFDGVLFQERMRYLFMCGMSERMKALPFKVWRDCISNMIHTADFEWDENNFSILRWIRTRIAHFEDEYPKLKETTSMLELALWKLRMNEKIPQEEASRCQKKIKTDESSIRRRCRITCGADVVIRHVLPYLVTVAVEESDSDSDSDSFASSDDESSNSFSS